jgi:transposase
MKKTLQKLEQLEKRIDVLETDNAKLRAENKALRKENKALRKENKELKRLLNMDSSNSSQPSSADKKNGGKKSNKKKLESSINKKRGAQNGHKANLKELLSADKVTQQICLNPEICPDCNGTVFKNSDELPMRDQFIDIPPIEPSVLEYLRPIKECAGCGTHCYASLPEDVPKSYFGPGVVSMVGILTGVLHVSKRKALLMINEVFNVPMSLGSLSNAEKKLSDALEDSYQEAGELIQSSEVAHADETGWSRGNKLKGWLWVMCNTSVAYFMVHASRGQKAAETLLGDFLGTLITDRWSGYNPFTGLRQLCWAHLARDFIAVSEDEGALGIIGKKLHTLALKMFSLRKKVRDGTLDWKSFQRQMEPIKSKVEKLLLNGSQYEGPLGGKCRRIYSERIDLWTFVDNENIDPTNNFAERTIRAAVLWRKGSFGTQSARGAAYVEKIMTACVTCRFQNKSMIDFLRETYRCHVENKEKPRLVA